MDPKANKFIAMLERGMSKLHNMIPPGVMRVLKKTAEDFFKQMIASVLPNKKDQEAVNAQLALSLTWSQAKHPPNMPAGTPVKEPAYMKNLKQKEFIRSTKSTFGTRNTGYRTDGPCNSPSQEECKEYAKTKKKTMGVEKTTSYAPGCYQYNGNKFYFNKSTKNVKCSKRDTCICVTYPPPPKKCYLQKNGYRVQAKACPNPTLAECKKFAKTKGKSVSTETSRSYPTGCYQYNGGRFYYNNAATKKPCSSKNACVCYA